MISGRTFWLRAWRRADSSLQTRILLPTVLLFALTLFAMSYAAVQIHGADLRRAQYERGELVAGMVAGGLEAVMVENGPAQLDALLAALTLHRTDVLSASVLRPNGEVAFSTQRRLVGTRPWKDVDRFAQTTVVTDLTSPVPHYAVVRPVENRAACARCHGPESHITGWIDLRFSPEPTEEARARLVRALLMTVIPALLLLALIAWWLIGHEAIRPLHRLIGVMTEAAAGNLFAHTDEGRPDELGVVARHFDSTLAALRKNRDELESVYRQKLEHADRVATVGALATGLAHEIKNPLAGLSGALEILAEDLADRPEKREWVEEMRHLVARLTKIMEGLLHYARPTKPRLKLVSVNAVLDNVLFLVAGQNSHGRIEIVRAFTEALAPVRADPDQLEQVLLNICLNALQAMGKAGGRLTVRTFEDAECVLVEIADTGPGIPPEARPHIFQPFFTTKQGGTGLGLAISARILADQGGEASYHCPPEGGTIFTVTLPRATEGHKEAA